MKKILSLAIVFLFLVQCKTSESSNGSITLENTHWALAEMNGMPVETPANGKDAHFILKSTDGEKRLQGFAGCNNLAGSYATEGNKITFKAITTKMFCQESMSLEDFFTKALASADSYKINGETLELYEGETFLAKFNAVK